MCIQSDLLPGVFRKFSICLITVVFVVTGPVAAQPLYKCGETWTNFPCGEAAQPVENLPSVREKKRVELSEPLMRLAKAPRRLCRRDAGGWDLEIVSATVESQGDEFVLSISVRNQSRRNFAKPFYLYIRDPKIGIERLVKLDKYLPFSTTDFYEENLGFFAPARIYANTLEVKLVYFPAKECRSKKIQVVKNLKPMSHSSLRGNLLKALDGIDTDIGDLYQGLPGREAAVAEQELNFIRHRIGIIALRLHKLCRLIKDGDMTFRCMTTNDRLNRLAERIKAIQVK